MTFDISSSLAGCFASPGWQVQALQVLPTQAMLQGPLGTVHAATAAAQIASVLPPSCTVVLRAFADGQLNISSVSSFSRLLTAEGVFPAVVVIMRRLCTPAVGKARVRGKLLGEKELLEMFAPDEAKHFEEAKAAALSRESVKLLLESMGCPVGQQCMAVNRSSPFVGSCSQCLNGHYCPGTPPIHSQRLSSIRALRATAAHGPDQ